MKVSELKNLIEKLDFKKSVSGGDHNASRMYLLNLQKLFSSDVIKTFKGDWQWTIIFTDFWNCGMIRKSSQGKKYRLHDRWEVVVIEVTQNTYVVSAENEWEAIDKMEAMDKPTFKEDLESVIEVVKRINYSWWKKGIMITW